MKSTVILHDSKNKIAVPYLLINWHTDLKINHNIFIDRYFFLKKLDTLRKDSVKF